jgi:hypothetical protein
MTELPEHIRFQLRRLIEEGKPAEEIAFMMRLDRKVVDSEIERFNTTKK